MMKILAEDYEYAGFHYQIDQDERGGLWAVPLEGQHRAALKDKHRRAAIWEFENGLLHRY